MRGEWSSRMNFHVRDSRVARCEVICELITVWKYVQAQDSGMMLELANVLLNTPWPCIWYSNVHT